MVVDREEDVSEKQLQQYNGNQNEQIQEEELDEQQVDTVDDSQEVDKEKIETIGHQSKLQISAESDEIKQGTVCWFKMRGFPHWPALILSHDNLPPQLRLIPKAKIAANSYPVIFYGTREVAFAQKQDIIVPYLGKNYEQFSKKATAGKGHKQLALAIAEAMTPELLDFDYSSAPVIEEEEEEEILDQDQDDEDDSNVDGKQEVVKSKKTKRRQSEADATQTKSTTKRKRKIVDDDQDDTAIKQNKRNKRHTIANGSGKVQGERISVEPIVKRNPAERLLALRHRLQKIFLSPEGPLVNEFHRVDSLLTELESFDLTFDMLKESKIGKVLKRISTLQFTSQSEEPHNVLARSNALMDKWKSMLMADNQTPIREDAVDKVPESTPAPPEVAAECKDNEVQNVVGNESMRSAEGPQDEAVSTREESKHSEEEAEKNVSNADVVEQKSVDDSAKSVDSSAVSALQQQVETADQEA
ncbi:hypothetical protein MIR68_005282 [Amoeboaphelidium protococcarum]|nr:hypothetical protein MIR68_005282 [Amoeboaphelidium protococcarum]